MPDCSAIVRRTRRFIRAICFQFYALKLVDFQTNCRRNNNCCELEQTSLRSFFFFFKYLWTMHGDLYRFRINFIRPISFSPIIYTSRNNSLGNFIELHTSSIFISLFVQIAVWKSSNFNSGRDQICATQCYEPRLYSVILVWNSDKWLFDGNARPFVSSASRASRATRSHYAKRKLKAGARSWTIYNSLDNFSFSMCK